MYDAVLYGEKQSGHFLTCNFCSNIDSFLDCIKKRVIQKKRDGETDKADLDSISMQLGCRALALLCMGVYSYTLELYGTINFY